MLARCVADDTSDTQLHLDQRTRSWSRAAESLLLVGWNETLGFDPPCTGPRTPSALTKGYLVQEYGSVVVECGFHYPHDCL